MGVSSGVQKIVGRSSGLGYEFVEARLQFPGVVNFVTCSLGSDSVKA
jgi:hypothetical protein